MLKTGVDVVLLDIEGTTSSIRFVHDEMFPFARRRLEPFLEAHWAEPDVQQCLAELADDLGQESVSAWLDADDDSARRQQVVQAVNAMMDRDLKATGLKHLQGLIWRDGFHSGELVAHLYQDVPPALQRWKGADFDLRVYSSGSIGAQRLFFGHTVAGDLGDLFSAHYDTTVGGKKDASSYQRIAESIGSPPSRILFLSDVVDELRAADSAGMQVALSLRPDNPLQPANPFDNFRSFDEIELGH